MYSDVNDFDSIPTESSDSTTDNAEKRPDVVIYTEYIIIAICSVVAYQQLIRKMDCCCMGSPTASPLNLISSF